MGSVKILSDSMRVSVGGLQQVGEYRAKLIYPYGEPDKLFKLAVETIARSALPSGYPRPEALYLGSSSDSYSQYERGHPTPPALARRLAHLLEIPVFRQFSTACASSSYAIAQAMDDIRSGRHKYVLVGGVDEVTRSSIAGFEACRIYSDVCLPFHPSRRGLVLSDGAAFFLLGPSNAPYPSLGYLEGAGLVSGASHLTHMDVSGPKRALRQAFTEANRSVVDFVIAHGTGTVVNDEAEMRALHGVGHRGWVMSYKGAHGHPQGASGAIGLSFALRALRHGKLGPTTNLVDPRLPVGGLGVTTRTEYGDFRSAAVMSHGTWDAYSALVVTK